MINLKNINLEKIKNEIDMKTLGITFVTIMGVAIPIYPVVKNEVNAQNIKLSYSDYTYTSFDYVEYKYSELYYVEIENRLYICIATKEYDNSIIYRDVNFPEQIIATTDDVQSVYSVLDVVVDMIKNGEEIDEYGNCIQQYKDEYNEKQIRKEQKSK